MSHPILHIVCRPDRFTPADDLLALLPRIADRGFEQQVAVLEPSGALSECFATTKVELTSLDQRWTYDPTTLMRLIRLLRSCDPAVVHTWDAASRRYAELAIPWASDARLVAQCAAPSNSGAVVPLPSRFRHRPDRWIARSKRAKHSLSTSAPASAIWSVVPPGVPTEPSPPMSREQMLANLHLPRDARLIGTAGRLSPSSGVKELIWAADMLRVLHLTMRFLIAGDGPERAHLERFAHTAAEPENIVFLGDTSRWGEILPHLDVYWQGTSTSAATPTALLGAMASGIPVVASDTPQHREWITDGETGYLVGFDARADRTRVTDHLFVEVGINKQVGHAGRERVEECFSLQAMEDKYAEVYRELLG